MINRHNYSLFDEFLDDKRSSGCDHKSILVYRSHLKKILGWLNETPVDQASTITLLFSDWLGERPIARATARKTVRVFQQFLAWYAEAHPKQYKNLPRSWGKNLHVPNIADCPAPAEPDSVTFDEILQIANLNFDASQLGLWSAQISAIFLFLSGMRIGALATLPLGAVDLDKRLVKQWVDLGVRIKNANSTPNPNPTTVLLDIPELLPHVRRWFDYVSSQLPSTAMFLPPTTGNWGARILQDVRPGHSRNSGLGRNLRRFSQATGLPYKSPHAYRHGHILYALKHAKNIADYQAISQNVLHADMFTTSRHYGKFTSDERQNYLDNMLKTSSEQPVDSDLLRQVCEQIGQPIPDHIVSKADLARWAIQLAAPLLNG